MPWHLWDSPHHPPKKCSPTPQTYTVDKNSVVLRHLLVSPFPSRWIEAPGPLPLETAEPPLFPKVFKIGDGRALTYSSSSWRASPSCNYDSSMKQWSIFRGHPGNATRVYYEPKPRVLTRKRSLSHKKAFHLVSPHYVMCLIVPCSCMLKDTG